jgi:hypothetical protein
MRININKTIMLIAVLLIFIVIFLLFINNTQASENPVISVNFDNEIAPINSMVFGESLEMPYLKNIWSKDTGFNQNNLAVTREIGFTNLSFGGNTCKRYSWKEAEENGFFSDSNTYWEGIDEWSAYANLLGNVPLTLCTNIHLTPQDSADWVKYSNIDHDYNVINWEMGNEEYIADENQKYLTAADYVNDAKIHCQAMKQVDPRIKCGIHIGFSPGGEAWTDDALFSAIKPGDFDFLVNHNYQPHAYFNTLSMYNSGTKFEKELNLTSGTYKINFLAVGDQAPLVDDPIPTLKVCLGEQCEFIDVISTWHNWQSIGSKDIVIESSTSTKLAITFYDDFYDYANKQDKNIFLTNINLLKDEKDFQSFDVVDRQEWTYSFLTANLFTEDSLDYLNVKMADYGLSMPIYETEYGWQYGSRAYPMPGVQYDWRSGLFDALQIQSLIKKEITQANLWTDLSTYYWRYYTNDDKGNIYWPRFYVFKLLREKTGDKLVSVDVANSLTYDAQEFSIPARQNVPYLSIMASKKNEKHFINVINRHQNNSITTTIKPNISYSSVKVYEIAPTSIESHPYRDDEYKEEIAIKETDLSVHGDFTYSFKPFSITTFEFFPPDITAPIIRLLTGISSSTTDRTPEITFNSNEAGMISYQGSCSSQTTEAIAGDNQIIFNTLDLGIYNNCSLTVTDVASNTSEKLAISAFFVVPPTCINFEFTNWTTCQSSNTRTRTVINSLPVGCIGGEPQIIQNCVYSAPSSGGFNPTIFSSSNYTGSVILTLPITQKQNTINNNIKEQEINNDVKKNLSETYKVSSYNDWVPLNNEAKIAYSKVLSPGNKNLSVQNKYSIAYFIYYGSPSVSKLGIGERAGTINSYKSALSKLPNDENEWEDVIKIGVGHWPSERNYTIENNIRKDLFKKIYLHDADKNNVNDDAAIMIMAYGLRPNVRNQASEAAAVRFYKNIFKMNPTIARDWDIVRAIAYSGAKR